MPLLSLFLNLASEMKLIVFIFTFAVSIGLSSLGLIGSYRLKQQKHSFASSLFYYKVFLVSFGFYGIWSHLFFGYLLNNTSITNYDLPNLTGVFPILGIPLLIVAWYLFIQFCIELTSLKLPGWYSVLYFLLLVVGFLFLGIYYSKQVNVEGFIDWKLFQRILAIINIGFLFCGGLILYIKHKKIVINQSYFVLILMEVLPFLLFTTALFMVSSHWLLVIFAIMFYFAGIAILPGWLYLNLNGENEPVINFESFRSRYEISKRESEIIQEICKGKTNKEIADTLFITLQTVKDHSHRIYTKTGVSNRVQLAKLVNDSLSADNS